MIQQLATLIFVVLAAVAAHAQEAEGGLSPFAGNVGNAVWTLVIFLLVVTVLGKFAWGPILKLLKDREEFIHKSLADAKRDREDAEARLKEYTDKLQAARNEAAGMIAAARQDAERLRGELQQKARTEADALIKNAERQIQLETQRALGQIRTEAVELSLSIASKLIKRNLSKEDNAKLIDETLKQIDSQRTPM
jgi:F-type H+-transporting ATPase subunit b